MARLVFFSGVVSLMLGQFPQPCYAVQSTFLSSHSELALELWASVDGVHPIQHRSTLPLPPLFLESGLPLWSSFWILCSQEVHSQSFNLTINLNIKGIKLTWDWGAQRKANPWSSLAGHTSQISNSRVSDNKIESN